MRWTRRQAEINDDCVLGDRWKFIIFLRTTNNGWLRFIIYHICVRELCLLPARWRSRSTSRPTVTEFVVCILYIVSCIYIYDIMNELWRFVSKSTFFLLFCLSHSVLPTWDSWHRNSNVNPKNRFKWETVPRGNFSDVTQDIDCEYHKRRHNLVLNVKYLNRDDIAK